MVVWAITLLVLSSNLARHASADTGEDYLGSLGLPSLFTELKGLALQVTNHVSDLVVRGTEDVQTKLQGDIESVLGPNGSAITKFKPAIDTITKKFQMHAKELMKMGDTPLNELPDHFTNFSSKIAGDVKHAVKVGGDVTRAIKDNLQKLHHNGKGKQ